MALRGALKTSRDIAETWMTRAVLVAMLGAPLACSGGKDGDGPADRPEEATFAEGVQSGNLDGEREKKEKDDGGEPSPDRAPGVADDGDDGVGDADAVEKPEKVVAMKDKANAPRLRPLTSLTLSGLGDPRLLGPRCEAGEQVTNTMANCGNGYCYGVQSLCSRTGTLAPNDSTSVIVDFIVNNPVGTRYLSATCPLDYDVIGTVADCGWGSCYGVQSFCVKRRPLDELGSGERFVTAAVVTGLGAHVDNNPCPDGTSPIGGIADCGGGVCNGFQTICATYGVKP